MSPIQRLTLYSKYLLPVCAATWVAAASGFTSAAHADGYAIGSDARAFAMGGAGLALSRNLDPNAERYNPAALGFTPHGVDFIFPSFGLRADGAVSLSKVADTVKDGNGQSGYTTLLQDFAGSDSRLGVDADLGFRFGSLEVTAGAVAEARILPNAALANWSNSGANTPAPANASADLVGAGYYTLPAIAYGYKLPAKSGSNSGYDTSIGIRIKAIKTYYTRYIANSDVYDQNSSADAIAAPELNGASDLSKTGVAGDLGVLLRPRQAKGVNFAFLAENLVNPGAKFQAINGAGYTGRIANGQEFNILQSTYSAGAAYEHRGITVAADLMDITAATGSAELRLGAEQKLGSLLAIRGGYCSSTGFTAGFEVLGIDIAAGNRLPLEIAKTIKF